jgi:aspartate/methionine/tyrosine aminotransferase
MCPNILQVYEYITYDENKHISLASLPGMRDRTIITSSLSKTYSVTGKAQFVVMQKEYK